MTWSSQILSYNVRGMGITVSRAEAARMSGMARYLCRCGGRWKGRALAPRSVSGANCTGISLVAARSARRDVLFVLRQVVCDGKPLCLGAHENVVSWADGRVVSEGSHDDMHEGPAADDRIEKRAAAF